MNQTDAPSPISSSVASASTNSRTPGSRLSFRTRRRGEAVILSAHGEADAYTLPIWRDKVRQVAEDAARTNCAVIIDASRLEFLSLGTVAALAQDARQYRRNGTESCLVTTDLHIACLAASDPRTADLPIRSTVVSALTAIHLRKRAKHATSRPAPYHNTAYHPGWARGSAQRRTQGFGDAVQHSGVLVRGQHEFHPVDHAAQRAHRFDDRTGDIA